jgi:hypothetical protein
MNNLVFTALCLALLYYLFYRPQPQSNANRPFKHQETQTSLAVESKEVQTIDDESPEIIKRLKKVVEENNLMIVAQDYSYQQLETKKEQEITQLKTSLAELKKQLEDKQQLTEEQKTFSENKKLIKEIIEFYLDFFSQDITNIINIHDAVSGKESEELKQVRKLLKKLKED